ncbi:helix-turn-helix transcriptional regulator [uncultured Massilia sp.]|uniref:helix-turn-helix transcriptional regulator n=1 Tax=uncultured Massilia sp. TaxID=169973 RepID=UPI0025D44E76|nr:helix-turn-helix transcriptional regulator [uncultured Massilia sp.]
MDAATARDNALGNYLKDRRGRLDPAAFGYPAVRRRTPGLRREEVAQRAHISATWYTWLEQGRGGAPSGEVLERIAGALMLTEAEREHLFLLALGRSPEPRYRPDAGLSPRIQRMLDALPASPAFVKTLTWDVVAWNRAADAVFGYGAAAPGERNILRRIFCDPQRRAAQLDWDSVARFVVAAFRADATRARPDAGVDGLVRELSQRSPEFAAFWQENDVRHHGEGTKQLRHPVAGLIAMEYSSFTIDGRPDLGMVVYNPATPQDEDKVRRLMAARPA